MQAIINAIMRKELNAQISVVISNRKNAVILERADRFGIENVYISQRRNVP